ncbi:cytochrome c [uncultured Nisaea sp.]|uniref:c-type cytochrome n=1 Tax=uncultured Nisaea sp. TaxID=538215 RepID=UPI0030EDC931|tara:strand:+ start:464 stop:1378 length:915 start_codon:yes stop_codon:yes gene_type:complete
MTGGLRRALPWVIVVAVVGAAAGWFLTEPGTESEGALPNVAGDAERGRAIFTIGGCVSCHAAPDAKGEQKLVLTGGRSFVTEFGTFYAPNISPDPEAGIGTWRAVDFVNAMKHGVSPDGRHYYPAFPYTSYARIKIEDLLDLWAYMKSLPASPQANTPHAVGFPFSIRRGLGLWKRLYLDPAPVMQVGADLERGRYLVEGPGHCGECHTPRSAIGGPDLSRWLSGAPNPDGEGTIPNLTPAGGDIGSWSEADIAEYLKSGFTPDFDTAGGSMAEVVENTGLLSDEDRRAIARYLKAIPPVGAAE